MKRKISLVASILACVTFIASAEQWAGWPAEGGDVVLPDGEKVFVSDADIDNFSKATSIIFGENSELVITNMAQTFFLRAPFVNSGIAKVRYTGVKPVVIEASNVDWTGTSLLEGASIVIVSNRYGLGTSMTAEANVAKTANLWFGGAGLTNDVPLFIDQGMKNRQLQHNRAFGPFVQNGSFTDDMNTLYGDAIINGTYYCRSSSAPRPDSGRSFRIAGPWSWGGVFQMQSKGTIYIDHQVVRNVQAQRTFSKLYWSGYQNSTENLLVFNVENAFLAIPEWSLNTGCNIDLNGYDQSCTFITKPNDHDKVGYPVSVRSSTGHATLTIIEEKTTDYTRPVRFEGNLSLVYSRLGKQTVTGWKSTATGSLEVRRGSFELADGAGWGGDVVNVSGGRLILSSEEALTSSNVVVTVNASEGGVIEVPAGIRVLARSFTLGENDLSKPGVYEIGDLVEAGYEGLAGEGSLEVIDFAPQFSSVLDPLGSVQVAAYDFEISQDGEKLALPEGSSLSLNWVSGKEGQTRYEFDVEIESGELKVYSGDELIKTVSSSGAYDIVSSEGLQLKFVSEGAGVKIGNFTTGVKVTISASDGGIAVEGGIIGENSAPAGGVLDLIVKPAYDSAMPVKGIVVNGVFHAFNDYPNGVAIKVSDLKRDGDISVSVEYAEVIDALYVDCEHGNDSNKGYLPGCPLKTVQSALDTAAKGMTVYLLPGVYSNGTTRVGEEKTLTRLVVPANITLAGYGNKEDVIIMGATAPVGQQVPDADGCGEDAVRCIRLAGEGCVLKNLTITGGRVYLTVKGLDSSGYYEQGAGVYCDKATAKIVDCIVSNCVGNMDVAIRGSGSGANVINTLICNNKAFYYSIIGHCNLYGSVFAYNEAHVHSIMGRDSRIMIVNSTIGPGNVNGKTQDTLRGKYDVCNSLIWGGVESGEDWGTRFYHSYFAGSFREENLDEDRTKEEIFFDECKSHDTDGIDIVVDDRFSPVKGSCSSIDAGRNYSQLYPAGYEDYAKVDLYGTPRGLNGSIDIGAVEYDWRSDYAKMLRRDFYCTYASTNVVMDGESVTLADGASLICKWKGGSRMGECIFPIAVSGGNLTIKVNGETRGVFEADTKWHYEEPCVSDSIEFIYEGSGSASISQGRKQVGLLIEVK